MVSLGREGLEHLENNKISSIFFIIKIFIVSLSIIRYGGAAKLIKFNGKQKNSILFNFQAIKLIKVPANKLK